MINLHLTKITKLELYGILYTYDVQLYTQWKDKLVKSLYSSRAAFIQDFFVGGNLTMWLIDHSEGEGVGGCVPSPMLHTVQKLTV